MFKEDNFSLFFIIMNCWKCREVICKFEIYNICKIDVVGVCIISVFI